MKILYLAYSFAICYLLLYISHDYIMTYLSILPQCTFESFKDLVSHKVDTLNAYNKSYSKGSRNDILFGSLKRGQMKTMHACRPLWCVFCSLIGFHGETAMLRLFLHTRMTGSPTRQTNSSLEYVFPATNQFLPERHFLLFHLRHSMYYNLYSSPSSPWFIS